MKKTGIGAVFTPEHWAEWLLERYKITEQWMEGKRVLDPTCGEGFFLKALISDAVKKGKKLTELPLENLFGIEKESEYITTFLKDFKDRFRKPFPEKNIIHADIILDNPSVKTDILVGNPPWQNFVDLPEKYKPCIKQAFIDCNLTGDKRQLLLGASRIDISALVVCKTVSDNLTDNGTACFFLPLSLFLNDGAHDGFRRFKGKNCRYCLEEIHDFDGIMVFENVSTRYGTAFFRRDRAQQYPIPYHIREDDRWVEKKAVPLMEQTAPLSVFSSETDIGELNNIAIPLKKESRPRQGINTCGANSVFIRTDFPFRDMVYPLITKENFQQEEPVPRRSVLIPAKETTGKPLTGTELARYPEILQYLEKHQNFLINRKGMMIGSYIRKGMYWACLGVGPYSFFPYKVVWPAYGTGEFRCRIFSHYEGMPWQANQALHAYVPCRTEEEAVMIRDALNCSSVRNYLDSFRMTGTKSWAQPGRMMKLFSLSLLS